MVSSLIALSFGIETTFGATRHVIRIGLIVVVAPLVFARFRSPGGRVETPPRPLLQAADASR